eukprot:TRINITY_DN1837_c0_g1_i1.p1 TRINITY_DN1837_c0_g1~~TRINITY_DN1837_c0_g1_i1.p1  ORF type:complete len:185 (+),score=36.39 TRINITY_DN1837_c0_g1_i1:655-1209(+)
MRHHLMEKAQSISEADIKWDDDDIEITPPSVEAPPRPTLDTPEAYQPVGLEIAEMGPVGDVTGAPDTSATTSPPPPGSSDNATLASLRSSPIDIKLDASPSVPVQSALQSSEVTDETSSNVAEQSAPRLAMQENIAERTVGQVGSVQISMASASHSPVKEELPEQTSSGLVMETPTDDDVFDWE